MMDGHAMDLLLAVSDRDPELEAMETCFNALEPLDRDVQDRVMKYLALRLSGAATETVGAKEVVLALISREHGLRGNEIVARTHLKERTVRTALHRLKHADLIHQINGTWHPTPGVGRVSAQHIEE